MCVSLNATCNLVVVVVERQHLAAALRDTHMNIRNDEDFYTGVEQTLMATLSAQSALADSLGILKPYSFVLENEDKENVAELYIADDDTVIIGKDLMEGLDSDLNVFLEKLLG